LSVSGLEPFIILISRAFVHNLIVHYEGFAFNSAEPFNANVAEIGTQMLSTTSHGFILPFEVVSMLLLAAMIGCIVIAMRPSNKDIVEPIDEINSENNATPLMNKD
jgi:NADH-quinone oxidoreductase subunit J